jgi:hypothetical protein
VVSSLEQYFPNLQQLSYKITSPPSAQYNCIGWALGDQENWWWPDPLGLGYWPKNARREETLESFERAFVTEGFVRCENAEPEPSVVKIALYAIGQQPTHAARQLENGMWSSKLGPLEDIEHTLDGLEGELYGTVCLIVRRAGAG